MHNYIYKCNIGILIILIQICDNKALNMFPHVLRPPTLEIHPADDSEGLSRLDDFPVWFLIRQGLQVQKYVPHEVFCGGCES